jgi:DNA (cytosine-5)-methyltransferase 1
VIRKSSPTLRKKRQKSSFKFIDLFAGIGGFRIAFEAAGGKCVYSSEWDKSAVKTYYANFGDIPAGDITKERVEHIPNFDVLAAGFPCQPFSSMGRREGFLHATQGTLFYDVLRIVKARQPKAILLENVSGLTTHDQGNTLRTIVTSLEHCGYRVQWKVLDAAYHGVPQRRKRIYIVGFRADLFSAHFGFEWPNPSPEPMGLKGVLSEGVSGYEISRHLQNTYISKVKDGRPQILHPKKSGHVTANTLVASYHKIQRLTGTFVADGPTGLRLLTVDECKKLMGFPDDWIMPVSRTQAYRQLGNSVAIPLVKEIGTRIAEALKHDA